CCARAASGHAAAAVPSSVRNSRRFTSSMGSPSEPAGPAYSKLRMLRKRPQVLGVDLNRRRAGEQRDERAAFVTGSGLRDQPDFAVTSPQRHRPRRPAAPRDTCPGTANSYAPAGSTPQPDCTAMYCLPSTWNDTGTAATPEM